MFSLANSNTSSGPSVDAQVAADLARQLRVGVARVEVQRLPRREPGSRPKALTGSASRGRARHGQVPSPPGRRHPASGPRHCPPCPLLRQPCAEDGDAGHLVAVVEAHHDDAPRAALCCRLTLLTSVRTTWPAALMSSSSSSVSSTMRTAATLPVLAPSSGMSRTPWFRDPAWSELRERDALAVAGLGQDQDVRLRRRDDLHAHDLVALALARRMPMTPAASRPMARTSLSLKRAMLPRRVASTMSSCRTRRPPTRARRPRPR